MLKIKHKNCVSSQLWQREQREQQCRREQTEPAVSAGRWQVANVQFRRGWILSSSESRAELRSPAAGQHEPPRLILQHERPGHAEPPAPTPAPAPRLHTGTSDFQSGGPGLLSHYDWNSIYFFVVLFYTEQ